MGANIRRPHPLRHSRPGESIGGHGHPRRRLERTDQLHPAGRPVLDPGARADRRAGGARVDPMTTATEPRRDAAPSTDVQGARVRRLQALGILCGLSAGVWLGAAEAPTKLVTIGLSPVVVSLAMVFGVFLARWSLPALIQGTAHMRADFRQAPHLVVWSVLAGALWAVANTLTIFAIRDVGLTIAFPLW